ncbi:MAG TPA: ABC transporter permease, partial [Vicinamibacterales bacterium]|nr:ABC transporter permease [Vicinamibacterales bacterium]
MRIGQDVRGAIRAFRSNPSVTTLVVLAFGLGIGITTAVFSIFNGVVLAPLPYPDPQELVMVYDTQPACSTCPASFPKYHDWKTRNRVFAAIGGSTSASFVLTGAGSPQQLTAASVTASLADVFRVPPAMGRWFTEQEDQAGGPKVTVLSHHLWTQAFGSNPGIIGQRVTLDGDAYEVVGVMPSTFNHRNADLFVPLQRKLDPATRGSHFLVTYARLKKGVTPEQAAVDMRALGRTLAVEFGHNHGIDVRSYYEVIVGNIRGPLHVLLGAVFLVLLIACANVANLLLASGLSRRRELAIRLTLGARQRDIARQLTIEALVLAAAGGAVGLLLAHWTVRIFLELADNALPRASAVELDGRVVAFAALLSLVVGLVCGLWPLLRLRARELTEAVRAADTRTASGGGRQFGNGLVVAEIALAFALLVGAGLLMKNLVLLLHRDAGIRTDHIIAFDLSPAGPRYQSPEQIRALYHELYARLSSAGGVQQAGFISHLPMYRFGWNGEFSIEGGNPWGPNDAPLVEYRWYYGNYLGTLGIPLLRGRLLDSRDGDGTQTVLINQA